MTYVSNSRATSALADDAGTLVIPQTKSKFVGPDALRSLAILLVMLVHLPIEATPSFLVGVRSYAWLGVDVFFVLSGYLIGLQLFKEISLATRIDFKSFYLRRAFRIFPAFFAVLGLYAIFPILRDSPNMQPLWSFATFSVNFGFDPREGNAFSQAWSLCVEEHFYLILPLLVLLFHRRLGVSARRFGWSLCLPSPECLSDTRRGRARSGSSWKRRNSGKPSRSICATSIIQPIRGSMD